MKKLFALLLAAVMCFSLVACGGGNESSNNEPQTNTSVSKQEATQPNAPTDSKEPQQSTTPEAAPDPKPAEPVAIELTTENFLEYFELVEILDIPTNEFGEVDKETFVQIDTVFVLKPEYQERFVDDHDYRSSGAIEWTYRAYYREGDFDYDTNTYTLGKELTESDEFSFGNPEEKNDMDEFKLYNADSDIQVGSIVFVQIKDGTIQWSSNYCDIEEFKEILRVQGTLYLYE